MTTRWTSFVVRLTDEVWTTPAVGQALLDAKLEHHITHLGVAKLHSVIWRDRDWSYLVVLEYAQGQEKI